MARAYYNEIDPYAAHWLRNLISAGHIAPGDVDERSIVDVRPDDLAGYTQAHFFAGIGGWSLALRLAGWPDERPVWTGSCPCQPFSAAGKRKGVDDARHLWPEFRRLIAECSPPVVLGEQVASVDGRTWLAGVRADLEALAYAVGAADLCAAGVGAPHIRQRLWWVAQRHCERAAGERSRVADSDQGERGWLADGEGRLGDGAAAGWVEGDSLAQSGGATRRLADADGGLSGDGGLQRGRQHGQQPQDGGAGGMGDADDAGPQGRDQLRHGADERSPGPASGSGGLEHSECIGREMALFDSRSGGEEAIVGPADVAGGGGSSFWSDYDFLPCTDGKARRVEPGAFPLAHGVPNRVGRLRAYGNAIVPQVAAEFVTAFCEAA